MGADCRIVSFLWSLHSFCQNHASSGIEAPCTWDVLQGMWRVMKTWSEKGGGGGTGRAGDGGVSEAAPRGSSAGATARGPLAGGHRS